MKIDIYKSVLNGEKYLSVPAGTNVAKTPFPDTLDPDLLKLSPFKTELEIKPSDHRVALDSADVINQIKAKGYATHGAKVTVTISTAPPAPPK
jgi:hypothetical protein